MLLWLATNFSEQYAASIFRAEDETLSSSETLVATYNTTRSYNTEDIFAALRISNLIFLKTVFAFSLLFYDEIQAYGKNIFMYQFASSKIRNN